MLLAGRTNRDSRRAERIKPPERTADATDGWDIPVASGEIDGDAENILEITAGVGCVEVGNINEQSESSAIPTGEQVPSRCC